MLESVLVFDPSKINIITTIFYPLWNPLGLHWRPGTPDTSEDRDTVRGDLAIQTITKSAERGTRVIVIDGINYRPFRQALERKGVFVLNETDKGMSASRQQGYKIAQAMPGSVANLWTEPEKVSIVEDCLDLIMAPLLKREADMVIPWRDSESFSTYPDFQADMEQEGNRLWNDLYKAEGIIPYGHPGFDNMFGPRAWHNTLTGLFLRKYKSTDPDAKLVKPEEYGNALHFPLIAALIDGKTILSVPVPFRYPEIQKAIEQYNPEYVKKRIYQQASIMETAKEHLALIRGESSRLALVT